MAVKSFFNIAEFDVVWNRRCARRIDLQVIGVRRLWGSSIVVAGAVLTILDRVILGFNGQMPVFSNPDRILATVKAAFHEGSKAVQKCLLVIDISPRLLNIIEFRFCV